MDKDRTEPGTAKNRSLNVEFWYPGDDDRAAPQTCPLILFSHGATGIKTSNESLYRELASHGYVVCSIDHTGQCLYTTDQNGHTTWIDREFLRELNAEDAEADKQQSYAYYRKWMDVRVGDINFVLDRILDEAAKDGTGTVYRLVDQNRIGVMGHSLGGSAALGIGRARADVGAVIALESPFLCDIEGVEGSAFAWNGAAYPVPVLNVYSDSAWSHLDEWPQYAENAALLSSGQPTAFNVHIGGAGHFSLTDLALASPFFTNVLNGQRTTADAHDCLGTINKRCLAFFDRYLKGQGEFTPDGTY